MQKERYEEIKAQLRAAGVNDLKKFRDQVAYDLKYGKPSKEVTTEALEVLMDDIEEMIEHFKVRP